MPTSQNLNATNDSTNRLWKLSADLGKVTSSDVTKTITLNTKDTYVDKDFQITVSAEKADDAVLGASATGSATISSVSVGTKASGKYPLTGSADISGTASATTTSAGYAASTTTASGNTTGTASLNASINAASATVNMGGSITPTVAIDSANDNILASAATTTKPTSGYYAAVKATAPATTLTSTATVGTAGYLGNKSEISVSGSTTAKTSADYYVPITAGEVAVSTSSAPDGYTQNTSAVVPTAGSLLIKEGYYPKTYITLATLVPDKATITNDVAGAATIRTGTTAYDKDGALITGTMGNATVKGGAISHTLGAPTYNSTSGLFEQSCEITTAAPSVIAAGYISTDEGTKTASDKKTETHSMAKIAGSVSISGTKTVKPVISKQDFTISGVSNAADGAATTTAPTSGAYIKINTAAKTTNVTAGASITTNGYGTSTDNGIAGSGNVAVGASASDDTYVKVKAGSASINSATATVGVTGPVWDETSSKFVVTGTASGTATGTATAGWITSVASKAITGSGTLNLDKAAITHGNTATETKVAVSASGTATGVSTSTTATNYYITVNASQTAAGKVVHDASISAGYTTGETKSAEIATSASITGNGDKVYLAATSITGSVSAALAGSTTGYSAPTTVAASSTVPQLKITGNGSATSGRVYNGSATAANKYINYYTGSYSIA